MWERIRSEGATLADRDPTLFVLGYALWLGIFAISLLIRPMARRVVAFWPFDAAVAREPVWAASAALCAVALVTTVLLSRSSYMRGVMCLIVGVYSMMTGAEISVGAVEAGSFSTVGAWEVVAGAALLASASQWVRSERATRKERLDAS